MSESSPRTIVPADIDNNIEAVAAVDAGARAEALSWVPNTKPKPRWDVHFGGLEDDGEDSSAPHVTFRT